MRRDETPDETPMEHLDEGTVHAWLDDALPPDEAARVEAHAAECEACGALVAEARGLIAGASRIVGALDVVPGGVIPSSAPQRTPQRAPADETVVPIATARRPVRPVVRPRRWALRAAAALVVMVGGTTLVMQSPSARRASSAVYSAPQPVAAAPGPSDVVAEPEMPTPAPSAPMLAPAPAAVPPTVMLDSAPAAAGAAELAPGLAAPKSNMMSTRAEAPRVLAKAAPRVAATDSVAPAGGVSASTTTAFAPLGSVAPRSVPAPTSPVAAPPAAAALMPSRPMSAVPNAREQRAAEPSADVADRARAGVARVARDTRLTRVAGCYTLAHDATPGWPDRVELDSTTLASPGGRIDYAARVSSPAADSAYWTALPADSVRVVWFTRAGGVDARLGAADGGVLRGSARPFTSAGAVGAPQTLVARRADCASR